MGKIPVKIKSVVYGLSPFQQKVMPGLWNELAHKITHKVTENWINTLLLVGPVVGVYSTYLEVGVKHLLPTVEWAMSEMLKHPKILEKTQTEIRKVVNKRGTIDKTCLQEIVFLKSVVKETLRLHPPAPLLLPRESRERCEINGYDIPAKSKVIVNAWAINRHPKWWKDPEIFNPERFLNSYVEFKGLNYEYIPFGGGRRVCPGISFGLANVELPLVKLLYHFDWKLPDGIVSEDLDMSESFGVTVRRKTDLKLIPTAYHPLPA